MISNEQKILSLASFRLLNSFDFVEIPDRRDAIRSSILHAQPGDMIAVIGKGHEDYQEINGVRHHFLDREVIEETIKELGDETQYDRNNG